MAAVACSDLFSQDEKSQASISVSFADAWTPAARAAASIPDTNDFILNVSDSKGNVLFHGNFGSAPENIIVSPGTYTVSAESEAFNEPLFDAPRFGDTQVVVVLPGEKAMVRLSCTQTNCGIRLNLASSFVKAYPEAHLSLNSAEGKLFWGLSESRTAYFLPGTVTLTMTDSGVEQTVFTRTLQARQMLVVGIGAAGSASASGGIDIQVDTTREWLSEELLIGDGGEGKDISLAFGVAQAKQHIGAEDVWVTGYIVGGDLSSSKCSFEPPFSSRTNLVIAARSSVKDKESCLSVQLSKGDVRDALNLVDHPENLGRQVWIKADIVSSYYGIPGLQNISDFRIKE